MNLTVIVASLGRPSLQATLDSIKPQLQDSDEILISVNHDCPWGHAARNQLMRAARGDLLLFCDDDDLLMPDALCLARVAGGQAPDRLHIFRMEHPQAGLIWREERIAEGNVSTQMIVVPNRPVLLGRWGDRYAGDFDFVASTVEKMPHPVWHEEILALYRPDA
jgi:glycosyltransferase involved in cell wall biosynthesis